MKIKELPTVDQCQVTRSQAAYLRRRKDLLVKNLQELWWMRQRFSQQIRTWNDGLMTFLGFKWAGANPVADPGRPSIVIVVPEKSERVEESKRAGGRGRMLYAASTPFDGPRWCWTDVIQASPFREPQSATIPWMNPVGWETANPSSTSNLRAGLALRRGSTGNFVGTLGHVILLADGRLVGTTAAHVSPPASDFLVGEDPLGTEFFRGQSDTLPSYFGGQFSPPGYLDASPNIECPLDGILLQLASSAGLSSWQNERTKIPPFELRAAVNFDPLLKTVVSIGATRGVQRGLVVGFGVQRYQDETVLTSDYLIQPLGGFCEWLGPDRYFMFSDRGDSGKPVWLETTAEPLGLLSGTLQPSDLIGLGPQFWSIVTDLNRLLKQAKLSIAPK